MTLSRQTMAPAPRVEQPRRGRMLPWLSLLLPLLIFTASLHGQTPERSLEYNVKAAFLFNFSQFTAWPEEAFAASNSPIVIGIIGTDPFGPVLDETLRGETVNHHPLIARRLQTGERAADCHILFISRSEKERLPALLDSLKGAPVLTVSDLDEFCQDGGMIRFYIQDKKMKFEINREVTEGAGIKLSSRMLNLARMVKSKT